jgi:hypothetical protein
MITQSPSIATFAAAFAQAQSLVENASKDASNPAFKRDGHAIKYADLTSVWDACRKALTSAEIGAIQSPGHVIDGKMHMQTMLLHKSGEFICGELSIPLGKADAQGYGSAVTYARCYALGAMMGVCPEDDDGNDASQPSQRQDQQRQPERQQRQDGPSTQQRMAGWVDAQVKEFDKFNAPADFDKLAVLRESDDYKKGRAAVEKHDAKLFERLTNAERAALQRTDDVPF